MAFGSSRLADLVLRYQSVGLPQALAGQRQLQVGARQTAVVQEGANKGMTASALRLSIAQERLLKLEREGVVGGTRYARAQLAVLEAQNAASGAINKTSASLIAEERVLGRFTRGAIAGSGAARSLGRSIAFSSAAFLGGAGLIAVVRTSIKAAEDHQVVQGQLGAALKASGIDYAAYKSHIDDALRSQRLLTGFTEEQTTQAFTRLVRVTGSVDGGLRALAVAGNIARGANISLDASSLKVARAFNGQTRGLTALGLHLEKGVKGWQAIDAAQAKFAGSSAAYATTAAGAQARFTQALHETEITIGTALLPAFTHLLESGTKWLAQTKNQERIQKDVKEVVRTSGTVIHDLGRFIKGASEGLSPFVKLVGGAGHALELAFGLAIGLKLKAFLATTRLVGPTAVTAAAEADAAIATIGNTALAQIPKIEAMVAAEKTIGGVIIPPGVGAPTGGVPGLFGRGVGKALPAGVAGAIGFLTLGEQGEQGDKPRLVYNPSTDTYRLVYSGKFKGASRNVSIEEARQFDPKAWYQGQVIKAGKHNRESKAATDAYTKLFQGGKGPAVGGPYKPTSRDAIDTALARTTGQSGTTRVAALKAELAYDDQFIAVQLKLLANSKTKAEYQQHKNILDRLYAERASASGEIQSIADAANQKAAAAARDAKAKAAARERAYRASLATTQSRLEARVVSAPSGDRRLTALQSSLRADKAAEAREQAALERGVGDRQTHLKAITALRLREKKTEEQIHGLLSSPLRVRTETRLAQRVLATPKSAEARKQLERFYVTELASERLTVAERKRYEADLARLRKGLLPAAVVAEPARTNVQAEDALVAFYKREAHDRRLTRKERASYALKAAREQKREDALIVSDALGRREDNLSSAVSLAKIALDKATVGTAAYDRALAAEKKALTAEERFYEHLAKMTKDSKKNSAALRKAAQDAAALKALDKKDKTAAGTAGANIAQFLSAFAGLQQFRGNYWNTGQDSASATHLYEMKHDQRRSIALLRKVVSTNTYPATAYSQRSAFGAFG